MAHLWQHPFVNVFKHFDVPSWKKASKEGEVVTSMDKTLKCTVYKITGSIPAGNYIQLPKTSTQSLGLTGRYLYIAFKPIPGKYFVVHIDVATQDGLVVRISFSNLFKEFKSTSTWLQFPFVCHAAKGSISAHTAMGGKDHSGPAPLNTRYTLLCLDLQYILSMYLNRRYHYMKNIKLCANMLLKNIYTSDMKYEPGLTFEEAKKHKSSVGDKSPIPRDMSFPVPKGKDWHDIYDHIIFPAEGNKKPFDSVQFTKDSEESVNQVPSRSESKVVHLSRKTAEKGHINTITGAGVPRKKKGIVHELPQVGVGGYGDVNIEHAENGAVHVFAHPDKQVTVHRETSDGKVKTSKVKAPAVLPGKQPTYKTLTPDPIIALRRIVGFGGSSTKDALWSFDGTTVVYPCHAIVVAMQANNGQQRFFIGHTDKVSCIAMNGSSSLLASGQTGPQSVVRVWNFKGGECLSMFKTHSHSLQCLSMSHNGHVLCGVGKDNHGKNMVVIWNTGQVTSGGQVVILAKAHTDVDIVRMKIAAFDDTRMISCGRDNLRVWRVKEGQLRSAPVNLGEYHSMEFTDCCFDVEYEATKDPLDRIVYACSRSGHILEVQYQKLAIQNVRRLHPTDAKKKDKQTFNSGPGIAVNCMSVKEAFCVTGSDDGFLRLWPLDFKQVYLEAEHEGPVTAVDISSDGIKILAGTSTGNVGILDIATRGYSTVMRSHTDRVLSVSLDAIKRHIATVSSDHTIRIWDLDTMQQLYDFTAPKECPCAIIYHPSQHIFACGFESGCVRVFNVATTSMLAEHKQHKGKVTGLVFSPGGDYLYSSGSLGSLALYDASDNNYQLLRVLGNTTAMGEEYGPNALTVSPSGTHVAFVGPSEFTVSVVDAKSLDEVLRLDITSLAPIAETNRSFVDGALRVLYAPSNVKQLLVVTKSNKLLKFDARNGKILTEIANIHRKNCSALDVSVDGRHLATAGDKVLKIWDYHMRLDLNFQVFIGHSDVIQQVVFTPDSLCFLSVGEAIMMWDFMAHVHDTPETGGRAPVKNYYTGETEEVDFFRSPAIGSTSSEIDAPRSTRPKPAILDPSDTVESGLFGQDGLSEGPVEEEVLVGPDLNGSQGFSTEESDDEGHKGELFRRAEIHRHHEEAASPSGTPSKRPLSRSTTPKKVGSPTRAASPGKALITQPTVNKHFSQRERQHELAQRRYIAPPNQAGLKLKGSVGYNGNGRSNMVWHADTGVFAYSSGCIVVVEDLSEGTQQHLVGHVEEISTLALQHDCQILASASCAGKQNSSQVCLWDLNDMKCKRILTRPDHNVIGLAYSRDDRFLVSIGDYKDNSVVVWSTHDQMLLVSTKTTFPIHDVKWDPYTVNEFATVGDNGSVLFWLLDETGATADLNVHEAKVPDDLLQTHHVGSNQVDFTCLEYAGDSTLYIAASSGSVSAWDTRHNTCFMHWEADSHEIDILISKGSRLITGSLRHLRLWTTVGVTELKMSPDQSSLRDGNLQMEDEITVDGPIISAAFDDTMDMGIVGTTAGTLWYINWTERSSIRLSSGHMQKINGLVQSDDKFFATCADDGSIRLWSIAEREQTLQFQVMDQSCTCLAFAPLTPEMENTSRPIKCGTASATAVSQSKEDGVRLPSLVGGYSDGTVRMFDLGKVEMVLKMHPHATAVTAISFSADGRMILSGSSDGIVAVSSPTTGMTVRVINDHKGAPITCIDVAFLQEQDFGVYAPMLWLAGSADRRVSVWAADWSKDFCDLVDWLTFPAPAFTPSGTTITKSDKSHYLQLPPTLAKFSLEEPDIIVYTGYGMQKQIQLYSMAQKKVVRTIALTHWAQSLDLSPTSTLIAVGCNERLLKLIDYYEGSFQDFVGHSDGVLHTRFSPDGETLYSSAHNEIILWKVSL